MKEERGVPEGLVEGAADILCVVAKSGKLQYVNAAVERLLGFEVEELVGLIVFDLLHPADLDDVRQALKRPGEVIEARCEHQDGHWVYLEISVGLSPCAEGTVLVVRDVSERQMAIQALEASEEKFRALFEDSRDAICFGTADGQLLDVNPAALKLFGYDSKEEMLELNIGRDLYWNPEERERNQGKFQKKGVVEVDLKTRDGRKIRVRESGSAIRDRDGEFVGFRAILRPVGRA